MRDGDYIFIVKFTLSLGFFSLGLLSIYLPGLAQAHKWLFLASVWIIDKAGIGGLGSLILGTLLFWGLGLVIAFISAHFVVKGEESKLLAFKQRLESKKRKK